MVHAALPTHTAATLPRIPATSQLLLALKPAEQLPIGVPNEANVTPVMAGWTRAPPERWSPLASALATWTDGALHAASSLAEQLVAVAPRLGPLAGCLESLGQLGGARTSWTNQLCPSPAS